MLNYAKGRGRARSIAAVIVLTAMLHCRSDAQNGDPTALHLDDYSGNHNNVLGTTNPEASRFLMGWNWGDRPPRVLSNAMHMNTWHGGSEAYLGIHPTIVSANDATFAMDLIWSVDDDINSTIGSWSAVGGRNTDKIVLQAQAMHYSPLPDISVVAGNLSTFTVYETAQNGRDRSGGAFGFLTRTHGSREWLADAGKYTFALRPNGAPGNVAIKDVLARPWPDDELFRHTAGPINNEGDYNASRMFISINLRRLDGDADIQDGEAVLRIRLPYDLVGESSPPSAYISFLEGPTDDAVFLELGADRGKYKTLTPTSGSEIIITRNMLPKLSQGASSGRDITLSAYFEFDGSGNPELQRRPFGDGDVTHVHKLGIEIDYWPRADIGINWLRFETPHAQSLFRGTYDGLIEEAIESDLTEIDAYVGTSKKHNVTVSRFYGVDEASRSIWWAQRYFNKLVDGRFASETATSVNIDGDPNTTRYYYKMYDQIIEPNESWGEGDLRLSKQNAAPYILGGEYGTGAPEFLGFNTDFFYNGYDASGQTIVDPDDPEYQTHHETYARFNSAWQLPPIASGADYDNFMRGSLKSIQGAMEHSMYTAYHLNSDFLFNEDKHWWLNLWSFSRWNLPSIANPNNYPFLGDSHRPKTGEELRLQMWTAILLGAKGILHFRGTSSNPAAGTVMQVGYTNREDLTPTEQLAFAMDNDALLGGDFIVLSDPAGDYTEIDTRMPDQDLVKNSLLGGHNKLYVGRRSTRVEAQRLHDWIVGPSHVAEEAVVGDLLLNLRLRAWLDFGYQSVPIETKRAGSDLDRLEALIDVPNITANFLNSHIDDVVNNASVSEDRFFGISYLQHTDLNPDDVCYIGVVNRTVNPTVSTGSQLATTDAMVLSDVAGHTPIYFLSTAEFDHEVSMANLTEFSQAGARVIEIPFLNAQNISVQEVGKQGNLTLVNNVLSLNMKPGEGKLLRVQKVAVPGACCDNISIAANSTSFNGSCCVDMTVSFDPEVSDLCRVYSIGLFAHGAGFDNLNIAHTQWEPASANQNKALFLVKQGQTPLFETINFSFCRENSTERSVTVRLYGEYGDVICSESFDLECEVECCQRLETRAARIADEPGGDCCWELQIRPNSSLCLNDNIHEINIVPTSGVPSSITESFTSSAPIDLGDGEQWLKVAQVCNTGVVEYDIVMLDALGAEICRQPIQTSCDPACCPSLTIEAEFVDYHPWGCCEYNIIVRQNPADQCDIALVDVYAQANGYAHLSFSYSGSAPSDYRTPEGVIVDNICSAENTTFPIWLVFRDAQGRELCVSETIELTCDRPSPPDVSGKEASFTDRQSAASHSLRIAPNPANNEARISYTLHKDSEVRVSLVDVMGRVLETLAAGSQLEGRQSLNYSTGHLASGMYYLRLEIDGHVFNSPLAVSR